VIDVGGGSTEIAIGPAHGRPDQVESLRVGSSLLRERHLCSDPPAPEELEAARAEVEEALAPVDAGPLDSAVAVGGTATSLHLVVGPRLTAETLRQGLKRLCAQPADAAAQALGLDPQRARLLPAGILVLAGVAARLGTALRIVRGGVREGAVLELAGSPG
jgi:exopolyphosphatase/guanosine-5'-triphosphate,3'-diphosphate pyrophosphatase